MEFLRVNLAYLFVFVTIMVAVVSWFCAKKNAETKVRKEKLAYADFENLIAKYKNKRNVFGWLFTGFLFIKIIVMLVFFRNENFDKETLDLITWCVLIVSMWFLVRYVTLMTYYEKYLKELK